MLPQYSRTAYDNQIDHRYNVPSYEKFLNDSQEKNFDKICMTEIVNADLMIASFGEEKYAHGVSDVLNDIQTALKSIGLENLVYVYVFSYNNFIVTTNAAISDKDFEKLMLGFYQQYELSTSQATELAGISRFVLVFGKDDMIGRAKSTLYFYRQSQENFIISTNEKEIMHREFTENVEIFELLNYAIKHDTVVPYYQGILDNATGKITKYEALMRIYDKDGKIFSPGIFLDGAKSFKIYHLISKMMLDKAMTEFENMPFELGLNISLYDVLSADFKEWFLERIKNHPNPSQLTVEFVETENYNSDKVLVEFLTEVRKAGCKIALDDFGSGYATYSAVISLKPDFIKVDGTIIKDLITNQENKIILDSICYMARLINAKIVAEFIESEDIQQVVLSCNIEQSQGYLFSKPRPLSEISLEK